MFQYIDALTVKLAELRAPGVSKLDSEFLRKEMTSMFSGIQDSALRTDIENRLRSVEYLIPSLKSLFKDLRYLEPAAKAIKSLLPESSKGTLRHNLRYLLTRMKENSLAIQENEMSYSMVDGCFDDLFDLAIRELFLCAMRYFAYPANISTKKDMNPIKQTLNGPKRFLGYKLRDLAYRLGFELPTAVDNYEDPVERLLADLLSSLPKEIFKLDSNVPLNFSRSFKEYLANSIITTPSSTHPPITTVAMGEPLSRRSGRACGDPQGDNDRSHLFLRKMHCPLSEFQLAGYDISSFYVKRCKYLAFFGAVEVPLAVEPTRCDVQEEEILINESHPEEANDLDDMTVDSDRVPQSSPTTGTPLNQDQV